MNKIAEGNPEEQWMKYFWIQQIFHFLEASKWRRLISFTHRRYFIPCSPRAVKHDFARALPRRRSVPSYELTTRKQLASGPGPRLGVALLHMDID